MAVGGTCGCWEHLWPLACGLAVSGTGCWAGMLSVGPMVARGMLVTIAVGGACGCQWGWRSLVWPKAGKQTWPVPRLAPPACCPCFLLPRTLQRSPTVLSEVPFPTARFPSRDAGSIEACDKCLHTDPLPAVSVCRGHQAAAHLPAPATLLVKVHFCKYVHIK